MPKPFLSPSSTSTAPLSRRTGIRFRYHSSPSPKILNSRRRDIIATRQCRYTPTPHRRGFSQLTPKPLARLHDRRDIDAFFFSGRSSNTTHSNRNRRDDGDRTKNTRQADQTVKYDIPGSEGDHKPPDERVVRLGKTLRKLSPLLPNILIHPLPTEILSPQITLHLFPSTHPHLPNVKGRVLYRAALWTVPVAWSSLPLLGNVKLQILSERMVRADSVLGCENYATTDCGEERFVVRWKTSHDPSTTTTSSSSSSSSLSSTSTSTSTSNTRTSDTGINKSLSTLLGGDAPIFLPGKEGRFEGLFIFAFDEKGRIASHTIEHADRADGWDRTAKFVTLTDWLLGKARGSLMEGGGGTVAGPALIVPVDSDRARQYQSDRSFGWGAADGLKGKVESSVIMVEFDETLRCSK
ncbi:conserved hypothetical protein [Talaromyces stipitatus ATCC 10500]|uniref:Chromosome transmission fidelity protein 4 n=1 Tax=Talaromyces stipitatus (strain ATCC 10500 / CBS 375.48 / QM 6759 / NRRL 1006) TaxID=441959 RepID=B8MKQ1_TALSN|nr:uncharacterized protein TSTA_043710 [Talaromyces stipitatus ATCC 10500]EED14900.1 conserved hypothetical protein [Talaromyces stipitatus ATCC 10500]